MQTPEYKPLTIGDWIITQLLLCIPLVGIVLLFVWGFSSDTHPSKKSFCQAYLILAGCIIALAIVFVIVFGGFAAVMSHNAQQLQRQ